MNKQSEKVELCVLLHAALKNNRAYLLRTEITKSRLNNHICKHWGMKTNTVTPTFYYVFNIYLYCNDTIPSFIANLMRILLLGNHLKRKRETGHNLKKWGILRFSAKTEGLESPQLSHNIPKVTSATFRKVVFTEQWNKKSSASQYYSGTPLKQRPR